MERQADPNLNYKNCSTKTPCKEKAFSYGDLLETPKSPELFSNRPHININVQDKDNSVKQKLFTSKKVSPKLFLNQPEFKKENHNQLVKQELSASQKLSGLNPGKSYSLQVPTRLVNDRIVSSDINKRTSYPESSAQQKASLKTDNPSTYPSHVIGPKTLIGRQRLAESKVNPHDRAARFRKMRQELASDRDEDYELRNHIPLPHKSQAPEEASTVTRTLSTLQEAPAAVNLSQKRMPLAPLREAPLSLRRDHCKESAPGGAVLQPRKPAPASVAAKIADGTYLHAAKNQNIQAMAEGMTLDTLEKFRVNGNVYPVVNLLGRGGSSKVYTVYNEATKEVLAVKKVDLSETDLASQQSYRNEISLLRQLENCQRVNKMLDYEYKEAEKVLYIVMERGDTDLVQVLRDLSNCTDHSDSLDIKFYWKEMLKAVKEIHTMNVIHSDLKPANFILVKGKLKLIDFGIASAVQSDMTCVVKDTPVGTINYMSPESLFNTNQTECRSNNIKLRPKSDVWSLGCILYNLAYGHTPFHSVKNVIAKMQTISNPAHQIPFPPLSDPLLLDVLKNCLQWDPKNRPSIDQLLEHPYLKPPRRDPSVNSIIDGLNNFSPNSLERVSKALHTLQVKK